MIILKKRIDGRVSVSLNGHELANIIPGRDSIQIVSERFSGPDLAPFINSVSFEHFAGPTEAPAITVSFK